MTLSELGKAALHYAQLGYKVFPCGNGTKIPACKHGCLDATTDEATIKAWWKHKPEANIGLATTGLVVIDIDGEYNLWPGEERMRTLEGPIAKTPRGGKHIFFQGQAKNSASKIAHAVDVRGEGGYVIVAPSQIGGSMYSWTRPLVPAADLPKLPPWLDLDPPGRIQPSSMAPSNGEATGAVVAEGSRNVAMASLAGSLRRIGLGESELMAAMTAANASRCKPPLPDSEITTIVRSIVRYEPDPLEVAVAENHYEQDRIVSTPFVEDIPPTDEKLLRVPGFMNQVIDHCLKTAPYPSPTLAFCGALALQALLAGRKIRDAGGIRTNLYILALAHSGAGKDWPRKINRKICHAIGADFLIADRFASGEGIEDQLLTCPSILFQTDEIDGMFQSVSGSKDARHESIITHLNTIYTSSDSTVRVRSRAGAERSLSINQPSLVLLGTAIPNHYYNSLSVRMLTNGLLARMLIFEAPIRSKGQQALDIEIPKEIIETAAYWHNLRSGRGNLTQENPQPAVVPATPQAEIELENFRNHLDELYCKAQIANDSVATSVWARAAEQVRKLALIYAASENPKEPEITASGANWAREIILNQTRRMLFMAKRFVSQDPFDADCQRVARAMLDGEKSQSELLRITRFDAPRMKRALEVMLQRDEIGTREEQAKGPAKRGARYFFLRGGAA